MGHQCGWCWRCRGGYGGCVESVATPPLPGEQSCYNCCSTGRTQVCKKLTKCPWPVAPRAGSDQKVAPVIKVQEKVKPVEPAILDQEWALEYKYRFAREMAFVSLMKWAMACLTIVSVVVATR